MAIGSWASTSPLTLASAKLSERTDSSAKYAAIIFTAEYNSRCGGGLIGVLRVRNPFGFDAGYLTNIQSNFATTLNVDDAFWFEIVLVHSLTFVVGLYQMRLIISY